MMKKAGKKSIRVCTRNKLFNLASCKRSQVTIWIILAVVIIAAVILVFLYTPIKNLLIPSTPSVELKNCFDDSLQEAINLVSEKGGSVNPSLGLMYNGNKIEYLCYTNEYYKTCVMQQPLLRQHIEREILNYVKENSLDCVDNVKEDLTKRGYDVSGKTDLQINILPENIQIIISGLNIRKEDASENYNKFELNYKSKIYNLVMLTLSILNYEARYGDSDIMSYMINYPSIRVDKLKQSDGSKIYSLTDTYTKDKFTFATRSLSWPAGYGKGEIFTP